MRAVRQSQTYATRFDADADATAHGWRCIALRSCASKFTHAERDSDRVASTGPVLTGTRAGGIGEALSLVVTAIES